jgi:hypothetical protein
MKFVLLARLFVFLFLVMVGFVFLWKKKETAFLGKFLAIGLILLATFVHKLFGVLVCLLVILYFWVQKNVDGMTNVDAKTQQFIQTHCRHGKLMHKNAVVEHPEFAENIFPGLQTEGCNICSPYCSGHYSPRQHATTI